MAKRKFVKVEGYIGILTRETRETSRRTGIVRTDLSYYARYKKDGREVRTFLGRKSKGLTPSVAANMRAALIAGVAIKLPRPRSGKAKRLKQLKSGLGKDVADDYDADEIDPTKRPPEFWTFDRLYKLYIKTQGGPYSYSNFISDRSYYNNHIRIFVGALCPAEITNLNIKKYRNILQKKMMIHPGTRVALETAQRKRDEALSAASVASDRAEAARLKAAAVKIEGRIKKIKARIEKTKKCLSPTSVERCLEMIRRLANFGAENNLCPGTPQKIHLRSVDNEKTEDLDPEQIGAFLQACDKDPNQCVADMLRFALATGLRRGSIFALAWKHVNFQKNTLTVKSIERGGRHSKTGHQIHLPLSPAAKAILKTRAAFADRKASEYVFPGRGGKRRTCAGKAARRITKAAGLPDDFRPFYGLRHAFASNLANTGEVDLHQIGRLLAHSPNSSNITKRYTHIRDDALKRATGLMSDIINQAPRPRPQDDEERKQSSQL